MEEARMMMKISSPENTSSTTETIPREFITTTTCPSWKLYENPFYYSQHHQQCHSNRHHPHHLHLPLSSRKIAASFWDLAFFKPVMESELDIARAQIMELKAELEFERKARKKAESMNKKLVKELVEERRGREAMERVCEKLAREILSEKTEIDRMKREMEEERKMMRMAEVLREERVQMKLAEAKILLEEKLFELEETKRPTDPDCSASRTEQKNQEDKPPPGLAAATASNATANLAGKSSRLVLGEKSSCDNTDDSDTRESTRIILEEKNSSCNENVSSGNGGISSSGIHRKASPEPENPHIKRGIKGFVEFPRVVRAIGSKSRHWGSKLECQKAQLRILLKQKCPVRSNNLIMS